LKLLPDTGATIDGKPATTAVLIDDGQADAEATNVQVGTLAFHLIERGGRRALRATDTEAETRTHFLGLESFPTDPSWRIDARW
ncbi:hypothetical protein AAEH88_21955, partial [Shewanella algae]|uniref:hypothetical protein n=1 Tax=Shewanella algae TaxID=38313 RepID=UPI00313CDB90